MFPHRLHPHDVRCEIRAAHFHLDCAKTPGEIFVGLPQKRLYGEVEIDTAGVTGHAGVEAAEKTKQGQIGAARLQIPQRDIERRESERRWSTAIARQWAVLGAKAAIIDDECSSWDARLPATRIRVAASTSRSVVSGTRCAQ